MSRDWQDKWRTVSQVKEFQCQSQWEIFLSTCIKCMILSSPLKRILNNLKIQIIFEYFMDVYNKLFPYGNTNFNSVHFVVKQPIVDEGAYLLFVLCTETKASIIQQWHILSFWEIKNWKTRVALCHLQWVQMLNVPNFDFGIQIHVNKLVF